MSASGQEFPFSFSDLVQDTQNEVSQKFPQLPTSDLLNARSVSKQFNIYATQALFYKANTAALFAQSALMDQQPIECATAVGMRALSQSFRRGAGNFWDQVKRLAVMGKLVNVDLDFTPEERQAFLRQTRANSHNSGWENGVFFWQRMLLHIIASDVSVSTKLLPYIMPRLQEDFLSVVEVFHSAIRKLDQEVQLLACLDRVRGFATLGNPYAKYWVGKKITLLRPVLRDIVVKLSPEKIQPYVEMLIAEWEMYPDKIINLIVMESFVDCLDPAAVSKIVSVYFPVLKDGLIFHRDNAPSFREAAMSFARAIVKKMGNEVLATLPPDIVMSIAPSLSTEELTPYVPQLEADFKDANNVKRAFAFIEANVENFAPGVLDALVEVSLVHFRGAFSEPADKWFLACEERLSAANGKKCRQAMLAAINTEAADLALAVGNYPKLCLRLHRVVTLLSPDEVKGYLPIVLKSAALMPHTDAERDNHITCLQAFIARMDQNDVRAQLEAIVKSAIDSYIGANSIPNIAMVSLLNYLIVIGVDSLNESKTTLPRFTNSFPLLEKMVGWHAAIEKAYSAAQQRVPEPPQDDVNFKNTI